MASNNTSFYLERTDFSVRLAKVVSGGAGDVIEAIQEVPPVPAEELKGIVQEFSGAAAGGLMRAHCSVYPKSRVLRNCALTDPSRPGEVSTLESVLANQLRVSPSDHALQVLFADDGLEFATGGRVQRELFICGAPHEQFREAQDFLVDAGVYPLRLEIGSVATIGLLLSVLRARNLEEPTLVLEIGEEVSHVFILSSNRVESARPLPLGLNTMVAGVRQELGLKDEAAARKLFYSDSFDFREMGPRLIDRLLREIQSMIGFYEVQTGQSITRILCTLLPAKLLWLTGTFAASLGMSELDLDLPGLLKQSELSCAETEAAVRQTRPLGLLGMMINTEVKV